MSIPGSGKERDDSVAATIPEWAGMPVVSPRPLERVAAGARLSNKFRRAMQTNV